MINPSFWEIIRDASIFVELKRINNINLFLIPQGDYMSKPVTSKNSKSGHNINQILEIATHDVEEFVNELKSLPDDFAHKHLDNLKASIKKAEDALVKHEFKNETLKIEYDSALSKLDSAISYLVSKKNEEEKKQKMSQSHQNLADELVVALAAINYLVGLLRDVQQYEPLKGVPLTDDSYKKGKKVEKVTGERFEGKK